MLTSFEPIGRFTLPAAAVRPHQAVRVAHVAVRPQQRGVTRSVRGTRRVVRRQRASARDGDSPAGDADPHGPGQAARQTAVTAIEQTAVIA